MHNIEFYGQCAESYICQGLCDCETLTFLVKPFSISLSVNHPCSAIFSRKLLNY